MTELKSKLINLLRKYDSKFLIFRNFNDKLGLYYENSFHDVFFTLIEISKSKTFNIFYYNNKFVDLDINDEKYFYDTCFDLLTNYYKNILFLMQKYDDIDLYDVAILNLDEYINFIEDILIHYKQYEILSSYSNPIDIFYDECYLKLDKQTKDKIYNRIGYIFNANKFDLI